MIATALVLAFAAPPAEPAREGGLEVGVGVGLGTRRPLAPDSVASTRLTPAAAASIAARPFSILAVGHGLQLSIPMRYETTIAARLDEQGPGLERQRRGRSHRAGIGVEALAALGPGRRVWLGGGVWGAYTALSTIDLGVADGYALGLVGARASFEASLVPDRLVIRAAAGSGAALADPRASSLVPTAVGLGVLGTAALRIRLTGGLWFSLDLTEQAVVWPGSDSGVVDLGQTVTAGLSLGLSSKRQRRATPLPDRDEAEPPEPVVAGPPAPPLSGTMLDGSTFDLASHKGRVVVVDFWASWCGPCREAMPGLQAMTDAHAPQDLVVVGVSVDERESDARAFVEEIGVTFSIVLDGDQQIAEVWEPPKMPTTFVIDRDGNVAATFAGHTAESQARLRRLVDELVAAP